MSRSLRLVSGGQTGVDRAALELALALGMPYGGWCPAGRMAEDGRVPARYHLVECDSPIPAERTYRNVRDSDATLILSSEPLSGGTAFTRETAVRLRRPFLVADPCSRGLERVSRWLAIVQPRTLNVAGPSEGSTPGIGEAASRFLHEIFRERPVANPAAR